MHRLSRRSVSAVLRSATTRYRPLSSPFTFYHQSSVENGTARRCYSVLINGSASSYDHGVTKPYGTCMGHYFMSTAAASDSSGSPVEKDSVCDEAPMMGLHVGDERIGVSISDSRNMLAYPLTVVAREEDISATAHSLADLVNKYSVKALVVGYPYSETMEETSSGRGIQEFINRLQKEAEALRGLAVEYVNERNATKLVDYWKKDMGIDPRRTKDVSDGFSASNILQKYLDKAHRGKRH